MLAIEHLTHHFKTNNKMKKMIAAAAFIIGGHCFLPMRKLMQNLQLQQHTRLHLPQHMKLLLRKKEVKEEKMEKRSYCKKA